MPDNSLDELFVEVPDLLAKQIEAATTVKVVDAKVAQAEQALKKALFEGDSEVPWLPREEETFTVTVSNLTARHLKTTIEEHASRILTEAQRKRIVHIDTKVVPEKACTEVRFYLKPKPVPSGKSAEAIIIDDEIAVDFSEATKPKPKWYYDPITEKQLELLRSVNTRATGADNRLMWRTVRDVAGKGTDNLQKLTKGQASEIITKLKEDGVIR